MAGKLNRKDGLTKGMRWTPRAIGLVASGLFLLFIIESGASALVSLTWTSPLGMPLLVALAVAVAGVLIAWRWEMAGGAMALLGGLGIMGLVYAGSGPESLLAALLLAFPMLVAGVLFLGCGLAMRVSLQERQDTRPVRGARRLAAA
jgi:hypothetical protein